VHAARKWRPSGEPSRAEFESHGLQRVAVGRVNMGERHGHRGFEERQTVEDGAEVRADWSLSCIPREVEQTGRLHVGLAPAKYHHAHVVRLGLHHRHWR
jgi:hypothetical protein